MHGKTRLQNMVPFQTFGKGTDCLAYSGNWNDLFLNSYRKHILYNIKNYIAHDLLFQRVLATALIYVCLFL